MKRRIMVLMLAAVTALVTVLAGKTDAMAAETVIQEDITSLRDAFDAKLGSDTYAGVSIVGSEISDANLMALVTKHFNAVTLGNELKPDALFGYSNSKCPGLMTYDFNGEEFEAPKMDYSRAEKILDKIAEWNAANPDKFIKVRGHVLVWHSQTPEWFFHENYDKKEPYVSVAEMDKRQEWYIKTVLEHFTTKYEGMFYGWDVVNEAISDATGTYRTEAENGESLSNDTHGSNSSWWKVYQNNKYIINAFKYANKYAPDYVELYYNDYNECTPLKSNGIIKLIEDVKAAEGTRLDGFGMQGHYELQQPTGGQVKTAARRYAEAAGSVSLTELDVKVSSGFDGSEESLEKELRKQYYYFKEIEQGFRELKEEGVAIRTITMWGVIDCNSWLQSSNNVGGASSGKSRQYPLLFDDNYQAKPLFYALCEEEMPKVEEPEEIALEDDLVDEPETLVDTDSTAEDETASETGVENNDGSEGSSTTTLLVVLMAALVGLMAAVFTIKKTKK